MPSGARYTQLNNEHLAQNDRREQTQPKSGMVLNKTMFGKMQAFLPHDGTKWWQDCLPTVACRTLIYSPVVWRRVLTRALGQNSNQASRDGGPRHTLNNRKTQSTANPDSCCITTTKKSTKEKATRTRTPYTAKLDTTKNSLTTRSVCRPSTQISSSGHVPFVFSFLTGGLGKVSPAPGSCGPGTKTNFADEARSGNLRMSLQSESNLATACATLSAAGNGM